MSKKDGGCAFPKPASEYNDGISRIVSPHQCGMSLRDYFAAKAQLDDTPNSYQAEAIMGEKPPRWSDDDPEQSMKCLLWWAEAEARYRYLFADAMIRAREKKSK